MEAAGVRLKTRIIKERRRKTRAIAIIMTAQSVTAISYSLIQAVGTILRVPFEVFKPLFDSQKPNVGLSGLGVRAGDWLARPDVGHRLWTAPPVSGPHTSSMSVKN